MRLRQRKEIQILLQEMSIESLLEDSIIADFQRDPTLQQQLIHKHDYGGAIGGDNQATDQEATSVIIVTATDRGEFKFGSGIRIVAVEVKIRVNGDADNFDGTLLDTLTASVRSRFTPSPTVYGVLNGRESIFSMNGIQVFGITNNEVTQRVEAGFERIRIVPATFIVSQVS
jgi:hypothetical protein